MVIASKRRHTSRGFSHFRIKEKLFYFAIYKKVKFGLGFFFAAEYSMNSIV